MSRLPPMCEVEERASGAVFGWAPAELPALAERCGVPRLRPVALLQEDVMDLPRVQVQVDSEQVHVRAVAGLQVRWHAEDTGVRGVASVPEHRAVPWCGATRMALTAWDGQRRGVTQVLRRPSQIRAEHLRIAALGHGLVRIQIASPGATAQVWRVLEDGDGFIARSIGWVSHDPFDLRVEPGAHRAAWALSDPSLWDQLVAHFWFSPRGGVERPRSDAAGAARVRQGIQLAIRRAVPSGRRTAAVDWGWSSLTAARLVELAQLARAEGVTPPHSAAEAGPWLGVWRALLLKRATGLAASELPTLADLGADPSIQGWLLAANPEAHERLARARGPAEQVAALTLLRGTAGRRPSPEPSPVDESWSVTLHELIRLVHPWRVEPTSAVVALDELAALGSLDPAAFSASATEANQLSGLLARLMPRGGAHPAAQPSELGALRRARPALERLEGRFTAIREVCAALLKNVDASILSEARMQLLEAYSTLPAGHGIDLHDRAGAWERTAREYRALVTWLRQAPGEVEPDGMGLADYQPQGSSEWQYECDRLRHLAEMCHGLPTLKGARQQWRMRHPALFASDARERLEAWRQNGRGRARSGP